MREKRTVTPAYNELKNIRIMKDMKLTDVAEKLGVTSMFISEIERGKKQPNDNTTRELAKVYGIDERLAFSFIGRVSEEMKEVIVEEKPLFNLVYELSTATLDECIKSDIMNKIDELYRIVKSAK